jgi:hypothetical protein
MGPIMAREKGFGNSVRELGRASTLVCASCSEFAQGITQSRSRVGLAHQATALQRSVPALHTPR